MLTCADCGYCTSTTFINMWDFCPRCKTTPFNEAEEEA